MEAIVRINMFTKDQEIYITDKDSETGFTSYHIPLTDVSKSLINFENLHAIYLYGNDKYVKKIKDDFQQLEMNKYNKNDIKIYINE